MDLKVLCACRQSGERGAALWGVDEQGTLLCTYQESPGGNWSGWSGGWDGSSPRNIVALTAAQHNDGRVQLWAITLDGLLHSNYQTSTGDWTGWSKGDWLPNTPRLTCICACEMGGQRGAQLWGVDQQGILHSTYQESPGGNWTGWSGEWSGSSPRNIVALTAAKHNDGRVQLWAITLDGLLHSNYQTSAGGNWTGWSKGDWLPNTPRFTRICVCEMGGQRGAQLWGVDQQGILHSTYQESPGGNWTGWSGEWSGSSPRNIEALAAAQQNDGRVALWARTPDGTIHFNEQTAPNRDWEEWVAWHGTTSLIAEISRILSRKPGNKGVTYLASTGNKFTLLDTPRLWGEDRDPAQLPAASQKLLDTIADVIGSAEARLDLTFLYNPDPSPSVSAFPDGGFQAAISRGFQTLAARGKTPLVRILFGVPYDADWLAVLAVFGAVPKPLEIVARMMSWLSQTITLRQPLKAMKCPVVMATNHPGVGSFNHAKIIVADDRRAVVGGHNPYSSNYLGPYPVHDVSGLFEGPVAKAARQFSDKLWTNPDLRVNFIDGKFSTGGATFSVPDLSGGPPAGGLDMLSLGRLGRGLGDFSISANAGVTARVIAMCRARKIIRISQQSLKGYGTDPFDSFTCLAIVRAIRAGVEVQIVVSSDGVHTGYGGAAKEVLSQLLVMFADDAELPRGLWDAPPREHVEAWADLTVGSQAVVGTSYRPQGVRKELIAQFNSKLKIAPLHRSDTLTASNHAKVFIIDDRCFYLGSDNFYTSLHKEGLQEFGYLIEDMSETNSFIQNYWKPMWEHSGKHALTP